MSASEQSMVEEIKAGMNEARQAMAKAARDMLALRAQRDELLEALKMLASQANDACGVMAEFVVMPVRSLSDKFPTTIARTRLRLAQANAAITKVEGQS